LSDTVSAQYSRIRQTTLVYVHILIAMLPTDNLSEVTLSEYVKSRGDPPFLDPKTSVPTAEKLAQFHASVTKAGVVCVLLAAGQGSRFVSDIPKVIYPYSSGGEGKSMPLASISMNAAFECGMPVVAIVGHARERVVSTIDREDHPVLFVVQEEQMGTGHAVYLSRFALPDDFDGDIIVTYADNPGIDSQILKELTNEHAKYSGADAKYGGLILTGSRKDAGAGAEAYGRIVRKSKQGNTGVIVDIVEKKTILKLRADNACKTYEGGAEWTGDELWDIDEFNSGSESNEAQPTEIRVLRDGLRQGPR